MLNVVPHFPLPTDTAPKDLLNRRLVILNRHHDVNRLFLSMISSFTGSRERRVQGLARRGTSASDREERLLKEAPARQNTSFADVFEPVDSGAEAADSQTACESVSPRDADDFGRRLLHISLPASERPVTSAACVFRAVAHNLFCCSPPRACVRAFH